MSGRRERKATHAAAPVRPRRRLVAGATLLALAGTTAVLGLAGGSPAGAAPKPNYTAGKDTATFTALGVLDRNCLVSVGGNEIWIKPGDAIDFKSTLAGIDSSKLSVGLLNDLTGKLAGLNVTATIDSGSAKQTVTVSGGKTTAFPSSKQKALGKGEHKITWTATSVALLPILGLPTNLPLSSAALKSGASLSWTGVIHVTSDAPKCKLGVSTPRADVSLGPIKVTVPQQNVNVPGVTLPNDLPSLGSLVPKLPKAPTAPASTPAKTSSGPAPYQLPGATVPEQVVPGDSTDEIFVNSGNGSGDFNTGGFGGVLPKTGKALGAKAASSDNGDTVDANGNSNVSNAGNTVELAADSGTPSSQLPVILAVLAIIALALVAGTYARLFLLKKPTS